MNGSKKEFGLVGVIARFKPLHKGSALMIDTLCQKAEQVIIGVGSVNKYDQKNPFTFDETKEMIERYLSYDNYTLVPLNDYAHLPEFADGKRWKQEIKETFGELDAFFSGNPWVRELLKDTYRVIHPVTLLEKEQHVFVKGELVRYAMAKGRGYEHYLPPVVTTYLEEKGLIRRFQQEFGLQTLMRPPELYETVESEKKKVRAG